MPGLASDKVASSSPTSSADCVAKVDVTVYVLVVPEIVNVKL